MLESLKASNLKRYRAMRVTLSFRTWAKRLIASKARYQNVEKMSGVPWPVIAAIHLRESSQNFSTQLAQGDPLASVSIHVPRGQGPYFGPDAWERAAGRALIETGGKTWGDWSPGGWTTYLEKYNGLGYANRGRPSPYVWEGTDQYISGKYISDGVYSPTAVDSQPGCVAVIVAMSKQDPTIDLENLSTPSTIIIPPTTSTIGTSFMNIFNAIWQNPFTSAMGAATFLTGLLHALGVNLPLDPTLLASIFTGLGLFAAHDAKTPTPQVVHVEATPTPVA